MRYLNRFIVPPALAVLLSACAHTEPLMPKEWGDIKTDTGNVCLSINDTFLNEQESSQESGYEKGKTLSTLLFPVMKNISIDKVKIHTTDVGISFGIGGKSFEISVDEQDEKGKVACTQRTWMFEASEFGGTEGSIGVVNRTIYMHLNESDDLIVREIISRKGVGFLVVPQSEQHVSFYRFKSIDASE